MDANGAAGQWGGQNTGLEQWGAPPQAGHQVLLSSSAGAALGSHHPLQWNAGVDPGSAALHQQVLSKEAEMLEKRKRRLEKNRQSARDCRRRKKEHMADLQRRISQLEARNLELRLRLKVGKESESKIREEQMKKIDEMVKNLSSEKELSRLIEEYKEKFADYGRDRQSALQWHIGEIKKLLLPTTTTQFVLWILSQEDNFYHSPQSTMVFGPPAHPVGAPGGGGGMRGGPGDLSPPKEVFASPQADIPLPPRPEFWQVFNRMVGLNGVQFDELRSRRDLVASMQQEVDSDLESVDQLQILLATKNETLQSEIQSITALLTPTQIAKFIVWIEQNPAVVHLLNQLWDLTSASSASSSAAASSASSAAAAVGDSAAPAAAEATSSHSSGAAAVSVPSNRAVM